MSDFYEVNLMIKELMQEKVLVLFISKDYFD